MDWHSTGSVSISPFTWDITGTSLAFHVPVAGGLPPSFSGQAFDLSFTHQGQTFGGVVAQGSFQTPEFSAPALLPDSRFSTDFASGDFDVTGNTFTLRAFLGLGHNNAELTATGTRNVVTASTAEPSVLLVVAAGLAAARAFGRRKR